MSANPWPHDPDLLFDDQLPIAVRPSAAIQFTPALVAREAARLLAPRPGMRVLDIGSGAGKLCLLAANAAPHATFVGVEQRADLVAVARGLATRLAIANVEFLVGDALALDWTGYDAFYLFNPFAEEVASFDHRVTAARTKFAALPSGARIVLYHGFGGAPPAGFARISRIAIGTDALQLWIKG